jgi:hypothetical protein
MSVSWAALGGDPAPGDPGGIRALAASLEARADDVDAQARLVRAGATTGTSDWQGPASASFRAAIGRLDPVLGAMAAAHREAAAALYTFAAELAALQATAASLAARANQAALEAADSEQSLAALGPQLQAATAAYNAAACPAMTAVPASAGGGDGTANAAMASARHTMSAVQDQVERASQSLTAAQQRLGDAQGHACAVHAEANAAAERCATRVREASLSAEAGTLNGALGYGVSPWSLLTAPASVVAGARYLSLLRSIPGMLRSSADDLDAFMSDAASLAESLGATGAAQELEALTPALKTMLAYGAATAISKARTGFADLGGLPDAPVLTWAGRVFGVAGIVGDGLTLWNPGGDSAAENAVNRTAAAANLVGTVTVLAGSETISSAATLVGINAATDWVPVAGQVVMVATGLYLAGDWAYHTFKPFHHLVDGAAHAVGSAAGAVGHFVSHDVFGWL